MTAARKLHRPTALDLHRPLYELRALGAPGGRLVLEVWQLPGPATPRLQAPERTAALAGVGLEIIEARVLRRLRSAGIRLPELKPGDARSFALDEDMALALALLFRTLAPMRSVERMRQVADAIEKMSRDEAGYWLGMAIHRRHPRRVLAALRILLTAT